jgi:hypothetical protein
VNSSLEQLLDFHVGYDPDEKLSLGQGGDESVDVVLIDGRKFQAFISAFMIGGVLFDEAVEYDAESFVVKSQRVFIPYAQIKNIKEGVRKVR